MNVYFDTLAVFKVRDIGFPEYENAYWRRRHRRHLLPWRHLQLICAEQKQILPANNAWGVKCGANVASFFKEACSDVNELPNLVSATVKELERFQLASKNLVE